MQLERSNIEFFRMSFFQENVLIEETPAPWVVQVFLRQAEKRGFPQSDGAARCFKGRVLVPQPFQRSVLPAIATPSALRRNS